MSRGLTAGMVTEVTGKTLRPAILVKGEFDSGDLLLWSGVGSLTYNGDIYTGAGNLLGISDVDEGVGIEAKGATFTLTGLNASILSLALSEDYQGRPVTVFLAMLDDSLAIISDPISLFNGVMDVMQIDHAGTTASVSIQAENRLIDLRRAKVRRYTPEDQKQEYPADLGLDFVASLQEKEITWGKS